jgi:pimeloyl-ACP methyl ester carboxylesterase
MKGLKMSYESYRKAKIQGYYDYQLETLVSGFDPYRPTVILLPGGMGSQLERTEHPVGTEPNVINDVIWVDLGILPPKKDAFKLQIEVSGGSERDKDSYVVAAHGPLKFLTQTPYEELKGRALNERWNFCVFGFDWRRPLAESSSFFKTFIFEFKKRIVAKYNVDPIPDLTIVCHSMGGMACAYALRDARFSALGFHAVVTVATPFYGTSTQQERYYNGDGGILNKIYGAKAVAEITSSLPGPYTLMFLPKEIYVRDGRKLGLSRYPELDPNGNTDADPYDPAMMSRWPKPVKDHKQYLARARAEMVYISQPISASIASVFFNVRSSLDTTTASELLWSNINGDVFIPGTTPSPLAGIAGPGDGTVPSWSAWHAYSQPRNRYELKQAKDHGSLLEHQEVLDLIDAVVKTRKLPVSRKRSIRAPAKASPAKTARVIDALIAKAKRKQPLPRELFDEAVQRTIVTSFISGKKPRMVRRKKTST